MENNNRDYRFYLIFFAILGLLFTIGKAFAEEVDPDLTKDINTAVVAKRPELDKKYDSSIIYIEQHGYKDKGGKQVPDNWIFLRYFTYSDSYEAYDGGSYTINYKDNIRSHLYRWTGTEWEDKNEDEYSDRLTIESYYSKIVQVNSDNKKFDLSRVQEKFFTYAPVLSLKKLQIMSGEKIKNQIQDLAVYLVPFLISLFGFLIVLWIGLRRLLIQF